MADSIFRKLRDGGEEGELAPALTIEETVVSPFALDVSCYLLANLSSSILAGKSKGLVLVTFSRSPSFYLQFLKQKGIVVSSSSKWIRVLDCYTDPLGWIDQPSTGVTEGPSLVKLNKCVSDLKRLFSSVIDAGREMVGDGKTRFSVAIDSVNELLRHSSMPLVSGLLTDLRSHAQVSSLFWSLNTDLHQEKVTNALEYISTMKANLEPFCPSPDGKRNALENLFLAHQDFGKGRFHVRFKLRKGRVRVMSEEYHVDQTGINLSPISSAESVIAATKSLIPKVHFNLQLSEKERVEKEKVVLPFEHQDHGKSTEIYDGRRTLADGKTEATPLSSGELQADVVSSGKGGEIIYFRDSDDEHPDSDEDPDDDLDI
ncbi:PREDICTED: elongator complex protein 5 isoform X2 [Brassica oleracea var. oleracea]|uniref:elongator complex protein 5 isoform X2 n=1 Tax=Brassica oleracea var. oleracea TaxID=109376 RepID=UPI0006A74F97|nr:PREDICTED: elongator complex protein 5 isoform X2 [Brassica oleracea var. oleracea]